MFVKFQIATFAIAAISDYEKKIARIKVKYVRTRNSDLTSKFP